MSAYLAAWKVVDVPSMFTVNSLLLGVCPLAVVFASVRVCLGSWLTARDSLLLQVFLQQPLPEGWQWEARAMVPGIQILPVVTLHHLSSQRTHIMSLLYLDHVDWATVVSDYQRHDQNARVHDFLGDS
jgi:hypothetical protein